MTKQTRPKLYLLNTDKFKTSSELLTCHLFPQELNRLHTFSHSGRKHQFLWSRALIRVALNDTFSSPPQYQSNNLGALDLIDSEVQCSLSHSGHWIVFALNPQGVIGVDIETMKERQYLSLAKEYFTASEVETLKGTPNKKQCFYRLWTLKEAYSKMTREGIFGPALSTTFEPCTEIKQNVTKYSQPVYGFSVQFNGVSLSITSYSAFTPEVRIVLPNSIPSSSPLKSRIKEAHFNFQRFIKN